MHQERSSFLNTFCLFIFSIETPKASMFKLQQCLASFLWYFKYQYCVITSAYFFNKSDPYFRSKSAIFVIMNWFDTDYCASDLQGSPNVVILILASFYDIDFTCQKLYSHLPIFFLTNQILILGQKVQNLWMNWFDPFDTDYYYTADLQGSPDVVILILHSAGIKLIANNK